MKTSDRLGVMTQVSGKVAPLVRPVAVLVMVLGSRRIDPSATRNKLARRAAIPGAGTGNSF
jgi:hypothetical protein